ncbi:hypothetical protein KBC04_05210 [Candidatus Babeliales bacterium]|nr:hypothetical protein [Candidatus Babeliales bacterium]MBP9844144.1 hypothetical protein [Candidatus Babeliales bacterium]
MNVTKLMVLAACLATSIAVEASDRSSKAKPKRTIDEEFNASTQAFLAGFTRKRTRGETQRSYTSPLKAARTCNQARPARIDTNSDMSSLTNLFDDENFSDFLAQLRTSSDTDSIASDSTASTILDPRSDSDSNTFILLPSYDNCGSIG